MSKIHYSDNILVKRSCYSNEYLQVLFMEPRKSDDPDDYNPAIVTLNRYCVPGRCDTYNFDYAPSPVSGVGNRVRYFRDGSKSLPAALEMLQEDLDKPEVVKMLLDACNKAPAHRYFGRMLCENLLDVLAPNSKSTRAVRRRWHKEQKLINAELVRKREERNGKNG